MKRFLLIIIGVILYASAIAQTPRYKLTLSTNYKNKNNQAYSPSFIKITAVFDDNTQTVVVDQKLNEFKNGAEETVYKNIYYSSTKKLAQLHVEAARYLKNESNPQYRADYWINVNQDKSYLRVTDDNTGKPTDYAFIMRVTATIFVEEMVVFPDQSDKVEMILPTDDNININASSGFSSDAYRWRYSWSEDDYLTGGEYVTDNNGNVYWQDLVRNQLWKDYSTTKTGGPVLSLKGRDIIGSDYRYKIPSNLSIRVDINSAHAYPDDVPVSNILTYSIRLSAPHIVSVEPVSPLCYGVETGSFKLKFDRALSEGETLELSLMRTVPGSTDTVSFSKPVFLLPDNTFLWPANDLKAGNYQILLIGKYPNSSVATYTSAATHKATFTITNPTPITITNASNVNALCSGTSSSGIINLSASGGTGTYRSGISTDGINYNWVNFNAGAGHSFSGLGPGTYYVKIRDSNDCYPRDAQNNEVVQTFTITQPAAPLKIDYSEIVQPKAYGYTDGKITAVVVAGTPAANGSYSFQWLDASGNVLNNYSTTIGSGYFEIVLNGVAAGQYRLQVFDANYGAAGAGQNGGCFAELSFNVQQPPAMQVSVATTNPLLCNGNTDGIIQASASGGMLPSGDYTYQWFKVVNGIKSAIGQTGKTASSLGAGTYIVTITDANQITKDSAPFQLTEPAPLTSTVTGIPVNCFGGNDGKIVITPSGGTGPYKVGLFSYDIWDYEWTTFTGISYQFTNLSPGSYRILVRDLNNCIVKNPNGTEQEYSITITEPDAALNIQSSAITRPLAYGYKDGKIEALIQGGTAAGDGSYRFEWFDENDIQLNTSGAMVNGNYVITLNSIGAGDYKFKVYDNNYNNTSGVDAVGCYTERMFTVGQPDPLLVDIVQNAQVVCKDEANAIITAHGKGGVERLLTRYLFNWYKLDNGNAVAINQTDSIAKNLNAGTYMVRITDANGIIKDSDPFVVSEPDSVQFTVQKTDVNCNNGSDGTISVKAKGGSGVYRFGVRYPGQTDFTWTDFSDGDAHLLANLPGGDYEVSIRDSSDCYEKNTDGTEKTVHIHLIEAEFPLAVTSFKITDPLAYGYKDGNIKLLLQGGTAEADGTYKIEWFDEHGKALTNYTINATTSGLEVTLKQIGKGQYNLKVYDRFYDQAQGTAKAGCYTENSFNVPEPPPLLVDNAEKSPVLCKGEENGSVVAHAQGGVEISSSRYKYDWFRILGGNKLSINQHDSIATNLKTGIYQVLITDANEIIKYSEPFFLVEPELLQVKLTGSHLECNAGMEGTVTALVTGGTAPYFYEWSNGATTASLSHLAAGKYMVYITDSRGCVTSGMTEVTTPSNIMVTPEIKYLTCFQSNDGSISLNVEGGTGAYTYQWSNGATGAAIYNLSAGTYTVVIMDANGCGQTQSYTIKEPSALVIDLGPDKTLCKDQTYDINATINDPGARYSWTSDNGFNASTANVTLSKAGRYQVTVTTSLGCVGIGTVNIIQDYTAISAEFLVSTQVFAGEEVNIVNLSNPMPQKLEWVIPSDPAITVISKEDNLLSLNFKKAGDYTLSLKSYTGACETIFTRKITVLEAQHFPDIGTAEDPFIKAYTVYPNPNNGQFNVKVELREAADIRLRMVEVSSGKVISDLKEAGNSIYTIPYHLSLQPGTYVMMLETPKGSRIFRIISNQ